MLRVSTFRSAFIFIVVLSHCAAVFFNSIVCLPWAGVQMVCNNSNFFVGQVIKCTCSSDLQPITIEWYKQDQSDPFCSHNITQYNQNFNGTSYALVKASTEDQGKLLTCIANTLYGSQNKSLIMDVQSRCKIYEIMLVRQRNIFL